MAEPPFDGGCVCGAVRYRGSAAPFVRYTCHCRACQKLTSSAFASCMQVPAESLEITQGAPIEFVRTADSGNTLRTTVCGQCGSALFTANEARPRLRSIYLGTLDAPEAIEVDAHIFLRRKLPWVVIPAEHRAFDGPGDWRPDYAADPSRLER